MSNWHVRFEGSAIRLLHNEADEDGGVWSGTVTIHRGAPSADSHPEIAHGFLCLTNPFVHREFVRHAWSYEIPDAWGGHPNTGSARRFMVLRATGGMLNWTLVLSFPFQCPRFVFRAIARAFGAQPFKEIRAMKPTNDATAKPASLPKGDVPEAKSPPPEFKDGVNSIVSTSV